MNVGRKPKALDHIRKIFGIAGNKSSGITLPKPMMKELDWEKGDKLEVFIIRGGEKLKSGDVIIRKHNK